MKKLLKWVFPAILGIVPALGMDQAEQFEVKKPFFTQENATRSISRVFENGEEIFAQVSATNVMGATETTFVKPACATIGWVYNDDALYAQERIGALVFCAGEELRKEHTKAFHTPYTLLEKGESRILKGIALRQEEALPVNELVEVREVTKYKRPGAAEAAPYEVLGPVLYHLMLEETITPIGSGWIGMCTGCGKKDGYKGVLHSGGKHNLQSYNNAREVTQTLWQIPLNGERIKKEETTKKHANAGTLYDGRRDHNIKADLQAADYYENLTGWILH